MAQYPLNSCLLVSSSNAPSHSTFLGANIYLGAKTFRYTAGQSEKIKIGVWKHINRGWLHNYRFRYVLFVWRQKSNLSSRAKRLLVRCVHSAQKCIVASCYIMMLHLNCAIAGVIRVWNGLSACPALCAISLIHYFIFFFFFQAQKNEQGTS